MAELRDSSGAVELEAPRVLLIHPSDEQYGADRMLLQAVKALHPHARVTVWVPDDIRYEQRPLSQALTALPITVERVGLPVLRRRELNLRALPRLLAQAMSIRREIAGTSPDLVILSTSATLAILPFIPRRIPRAVHLHETWGAKVRLVLGPLLVAADLLLAPSASVASGLPRWARRKATVVSNGVPDPGVRGSWPPVSDPIRLLIASRWGPFKGHRELLEAWSKVTRPDLRLVILGAAPPTGTGVDVPELVRELPNRHTVELVGEVADVDKHIEMAHAVVMPSIVPEAFGLVAVEGMALSRPVIASAIGGCAEIVTDQTGWLLPPEDVQAWVDVLESLTAEECASKGLAARSLFLSRFSYERFASEYSQAVLAVVGARA